MAPSRFVSLPFRFLWFVGFSGASLAFALKPSSFSLSSGQPVFVGGRREVLRISPAAIASIFTTPPIANAYNNARSRSDGYKYQRTEDEWKTLLSPLQYNILREGGTEAPFSSILESEDRPGIFSCAGCGTELFESTQKFHSGTGWVSERRNSACVLPDMPLGLRILISCFPFPLYTITKMQNSHHLPKD
jgi:SelR domain